MTRIPFSRFTFFLTIALSLVGQSGFAQSRALREARSENGNYLLKIERGRADRSLRPNSATEVSVASDSRSAEQPAQPADEVAREPDDENRVGVSSTTSAGKERRPVGNCRAMLSEVGGDRRSRPIWRASLVNDVAPEHAFVRDDGRYVVTLDEYRRGGLAHAVVIYDERGEVKREFSIRDLLSADDWRRVRVRRNNIEWLRDARMSFEDDRGRGFFEVALHWNTILQFDLEGGELVGGPRGVADDQLPDDVRAALYDTREGAEAESQILSPGSEGYADLFDEAAQLVSLVTGVQFSAADLSEAEFGDSAALNMEGNGEANISTDTARAIEPHGSLASAIVNDAAEEREGSAGNSFDTGLPVPQPDPAHPVNYIDWMKSQVEVEGPAAHTAYQSAIDAFVAFDGDQELYDKAMAGDADALASEPIKAWLASNAGSMLNFGYATEMNYRGMPVKVDSNDAPLYSILLPHLSPMRQISKALVMQGHAFENAGDFIAADRSYMQIFRGGTQTSQGPTLIENLVGVAQQALASESMLDSFAKDTAGTRDFTALAADLEKNYQPIRSTAAVMQGERAMLLDVVQRSYNYDPDSGSYDVSPEGLRSLGELLSVSDAKNVGPKLMMSAQLVTTGFEGMRDSVNEHYDQITDAAAAPYQEARQKFADVEAKISSPEFRLSNPLMAAMLPSLSRAAELNTRSESRRRATLAIANIMAYRQQHGEFPESLDALGKGALANDPWSGQPFAYRRDQEGNFTLYSLGRNAVDDGSVHDSKGESNDYVFWPRPAKNK